MADMHLKSILITGGAGFIGSNLCDYFIAKNYQIVCLDNFSTGHHSNIAHLLENPNFTLIEGDIRDLETCNKAVLNIDFVLHQAALGSVPRSVLDPVTTNNVNVTGFLNMLVASKNANVKRFVYASSSSVYGDSESLPKIEHSIGNPLSPYATTKATNELYANVFSKTYGLETIGLRYFNVFGARQDPNGAYAAVIPKFTSQLINHQSPIVNGDGSFSRDFTYIDNVIQIIELAMLTENSSALNTVYNAAFGERTTIIELAEALKKELSKHDQSINQVAIVFGDLRKGDIPHSLASIEKAKALLGYNPTVSFADGLAKSVDWYRLHSHSKIN
jgi:UDP-N-acetylglucosamine 4-epimerase